MTEETTNVVEEVTLPQEETVPYDPTVKVHDLVEAILYFRLGNYAYAQSWDDESLPLEKAAELDIIKYLELLKADGVFDDYVINNVKNRYDYAYLVFDVYIARKYYIDWQRPGVYSYEWHQYHVEVDHYDTKVAITKVDKP